MTELSFLLELMLEDEMPKALKQRIVERIKVVEQNLQPVKKTQITESVQSLIESREPAGPPGHIRSAAANQAMNERNQAIQAQLNGKGAPKKFRGPID